MLRKIFIFAIVLVGLAACQESAQKLSPETFDNQASELIDKPVVIEGTVIHVCKHGGKRLFIKGEKDEPTVKVIAGAEITRFDSTLEAENKEVMIRGVIKTESFKGHKHGEGEHHEIEDTVRYVIECQSIEIK